MSTRKKELAKLAERAGSTDRETVEYRNQLAMQRASRAEHDLRSLQIQLRDARIDLETLQPPPQAQPRPKIEMTEEAAERIEHTVQAQLDQDPTLLEYGSRVTAAEDKLEGHRRKIRSANDPVIREAHRKLQSARAQLKEAYEKRRQGLTAQYTNAYLQRDAGPIEVPQGRGNERDLLAKRIQLLVQEEENLKAEVKSSSRGCSRSARMR